MLSAVRCAAVDRPVASNPNTFQLASHHHHHRDRPYAKMATNTVDRLASDAGSVANPTAPSTQQDGSTRPQLSKRTLHTEPAHIEVVLSRYAGMSPPPLNLAQGVAHWDPPPAALQQMETGLVERANHRYGPALGLPALREALEKKLEEENGLDLTGQEVTLVVEERFCCFVAAVGCFARELETATCAAGSPRVCLPSSRRTAVCCRKCRCPKRHLCAAVAEQPIVLKRSRSIRIRYIHAAEELSNVANIQ